MVKANEAMASAEAGNGEIGGGGGSGAHVVQVNNSLTADEISPLLVEVGNKPARMSIFSVSYSRSRSQK
ncbi:hypothetical protein AXF42_Ash017986 [Apostasia shenzhenica]|uniref:Uncharacterized protein n=1 Tax=Apostasia shenzhenica TaxID=1088818 RepID=A0A2I0A528_9ASPA|nr:hypothetical protein AXF42_Ash017986 [Apostasia shenzhenica]